jgi:hypothetical protein
MFSGSASGAGKSRLSAALARDLESRSRPVHLLSEDDLLAMDGFARFERLLGPTDPETHRADQALLAAAGALVDETLAVSRHAGVGAPHVLVTDALLPGFFWLFGRYDAARVRAVAGQLARVLAPLFPLLVYLRGDPAALVARAAVLRGADWPARMATWVSRWNVPHYPGAPLRTLDDVLGFWSWLDTVTLALLADWPVDALVLDALEPFASLRDALLTDPRVLTPS